MRSKTCSLTIINKSHEHENRLKINELTEVIREFNTRLATTANLEFEKAAHVISEIIDIITYQSTLALQYLDKTLDNLMKQLDYALHE